MKYKKLVTFAIISTVTLAGCTQDDSHRRTKIGAATGAVAGAVIGHQVSHDKGKWVGAVVGALAGGAVGNYMDNQQQEFESSLAQEQANHELEIERMRDDTLKLTLDSEVSFDFNRAQIKPSFRSSLNKLARVIVKYDRTVVHIIGHTDSIGSDRYNQQLSEQRAGNTANYLAARGVPDDRLRTEGRGESEPRATNATEAGRQLNRRVEIFLKPIIRGNERRAYQPPRY
ncbi:MAG: OmpA family protein [Candidatus Sedimenticola sp. (ex Thyasira tokunagai)]